MISNIEDIVSELDKHFVEFMFMDMLFGKEVPIADTIGTPIIDQICLGDPSKLRHFERCYSDGIITLLINMDEVYTEHSLVADESTKKCSVRINLQETVFNLGNSKNRKAVIKFGVEYDEELDVETLIYLGSLHTTEGGDILEKWYKEKKIERRDIIINNLLNEK